MPARPGNSSHFTARPTDKALLADADEKDLTSQFGKGPLQRYTPNSISNIKALAIECAQIKKRGFATDEAEYNPGMRCVAVPIRMTDGSIVGSIGISAPESRFLKQYYPKYARIICKVAADIGKTADPDRS